jgi:hypothetical protein
MTARTLGGFVIAMNCASLLMVGSVQAAKGQWSLGGNFGVGFYAGGSLNDSLGANGYKKVSQGWEYGASLRYGVSPRLSLDYEVSTLNGKGTTKSVTPKFQAEANGIATTLNLYYQLTANDSHSLNLFAGAGPMLKTGWSTKQDTIETNSKTKTTFYGQAGIETEMRLGKSFEFTSRALGRIAKANDLVDELDPSTSLSVSMSGVAVSVGLRALFGGSAD